MNNPKSKMIDGKLYFDNFMCQKEGKTFYGVYESFFGYKSGELITSGTSMESASKKAKLLQIGYDMRKEYERDYWYEI